MKLVFVDAEFTGEHVYATLVSIALVSVEGNSLYLTLNDYDRGQVTDWLQENVIAYIPQEETISSEEAHAQIAAWLRDYSEGDPVHLVSMGKANDLLLLFELWRFEKPDQKYFHALHDLPEYFNHGGHFDMATLFTTCGLWEGVDRVAFAGPEGERIEGVRHHALYDARILRLCFLRLVREFPEMKQVRQRLGLARFGGSIFETETNIGSEDATANPSDPEAARSALAAFGFEQVSELRALAKPSTDSELLFAMADDQELVLRKVPDGVAGELAAQCAIAAALEGDQFLRPLATASGDHLIHKSGAPAYMAYQRLPGSPFGGNPAKLPAITAAITSFLDELAGVESDPANLPALRVVRRDPTALPDALAVWLAPDQWKPAFGKSLSPTANDFLQNDAPWLADATERLAGQPELFRELCLVHNDLQHANILVDEDDQVGFLDPEDIVFASPGEALVHALFKNHRHAIFSGHLTLAGFRAQFLPGLLDLFETRMGWSRDRQEWFHFGIGRILFDIELITRFSLDHGDDRYLYDLNKKFENLIEFERMFGPWTCN